jgi:chromosome segregation ATPase
MKTKNKPNGVITKAYLDKKLKTFKVELKDELSSGLKTELYQIKDEIVGEIKAMREEFDTHQYSHVRINDELQEHSRQIAQLQAR